MSWAVLWHDQGEMHGLFGLTRRDARHRFEDLKKRPSDQITTAILAKDKRVVDFINRKGECTLASINQTLALMESGVSLN